LIKKHSITELIKRLKVKTKQ